MTHPTSLARSFAPKLLLAALPILSVACAPIDETSEAAGEALTLAPITPSPSLSLPCGTLTGVCVTNLGTPALAPLYGRITTNGADLFYLVQSSSATVSAARFEVATRRVSYANGLALGAPHGVWNLSVDPYGRLWAGVESRGNARFGFGTLASQTFDTDTVGLGAITPGFAVVRLGVTGITPGTATGTARFPWNPTPEIEIPATAVADNGEISIPADAVADNGELSIPADAVPSGELSISPDAALPVGVRVAATREGPVGFWTANYNTVDRYEAPSWGRVAAPVQSGYTVGHGRPVATSPDGAVAVIANTGEVLQRDHNGIFSLRLRTHASDLAFDNSGTLYVASSVSPVVYRVAPGAHTATAWRITFAASGTAAYTDAIPRALVTLDDGSVVVQTRARAFYRLVRV